MKMKVFIALTLLVVAQAASLQKTRSALSDQGVVHYGAEARLLRQSNEVDDEGFHYGYESSDGTRVEQHGRFIPSAQDPSGSLQVEGSYSFVGGDGRTYTVTYIADENGFRAEGDHLPTPPPVPEEIARALHLVR